MMLFLMIFLFVNFNYTDSLYIWGVQDVIIQDGYITYKQVPPAIRDRQNLPVTFDNIKLALYTKRNPKTPTTVLPHFPGLFPKQSPIVFIIHGWKSNITGQWCRDLKNAFLKINENYYVVEVDWSIYSRQGYFVAVKDVEEIGGLLGEFIAKLNTFHSIPLANFLIVGHSLGAQISGFIGKKVAQLKGQKLPRIIALDAAGPEFLTRPESERLSRLDAQVVHVIHTSIDNFGFNGSCGTIDFFPNGGGAQPGCLTSFPPIGCSHLRSIQYLIAALLRPNRFLARKCVDWVTYQTHQDLCEKEYVSVGDLNTTKTGNFYLTTTNAPPYYHRISRS